ncbi:MAG: zinc dependent phospholipase C family protein [Flavobacteriales bacterium]
MSQLIKVSVLACVLLLIPVSAMTWGFFAHRRINELAVYTLPPELFGFYKKHIDFIKEHAVDPDKRRYGVKGEAERHFIDADHYCKGIPRCNPFLYLPRRWNDAVEQLSEDTLRSYGIVPWHIEKMHFRLVKAFEERDLERILRISTEMGHYIGDAHVPLHTTENYNGQFTDQVGIHGFWESRIPELYSTDYDLFVGQAYYIAGPLETAWSVVEQSHWALDSVLTFEKILNDRFAADQKYSFEDRGRVTTRVYSEPYSRAYHEMLDGQVERRMRESIRTIGSFWYTAWVDAGQPDLENIKPIDVQLLKETVKQENEVVADPNINTRQHEN